MKLEGNDRDVDLHKGLKLAVWRPLHKFPEHEEFALARLCMDRPHKDRFLMLGSHSFVAQATKLCFGSYAHRPTKTQIHKQILGRYRNRKPQSLGANQVLQSYQHGFCSNQPHVEKKRNDSPIRIFQRVSHRCRNIRWHSQNPGAIAFWQNPHPNSIRNVGFTLQTWCLEVEIECQCLDPFDKEHPCPYLQIQSLNLRAFNYEQKWW